MAEKMWDFSEMFRQEVFRTKPGREIIGIDGKAECGTVQENSRNPDTIQRKLINGYLPAA